MSDTGELLFKGDARGALKRGMLFGPRAGGGYRKVTSITYDKKKGITTAKLEPVADD